MRDDSYALSAMLRLQHCVTAAFANGGKLFVMGNGGFGAVGQHFVSELAGRCRARRRPLDAVSLDCNTSLITCIANDFGFEKIYSRQLQAFGRKGDVALVLSASGKSKNIVEALVEARNIGMTTFGIVGNSAPDSILTLMDHHIVIPSDHTPHVQDTAMCLLHSLCGEIERSISSDHTDVWRQVLAMAHDGYADTLLLDRDGVINTLIPNAYVTTPHEMHFEPAFINACASLAKAYPRIFVVTNQSCIGRGIISAATLDTIHTYMVETITNAGGRIDGIYVCPDTGSSPRRKPATGMAADIMAEHPEVDFTSAVMVGDSSSDQLFAESIGATYFDVNAYERI